ncbi:MAG: Holliday junction resolvase RuvX [Gammaproteobacteria bacterium]|nr:Holliday junction resolvase RuvX [Gammaproteobacteria bacterium]
MTEGPSVLLGFDYGTRRIGVAVGETVTGRARPLGLVPVHRNRPDWTVVTRLIDEWRPGRLVVGLPLTLDGEEQPASDGARRFGRQLEGRYRLPVELVDERLTTRAAREELAGAGRWRDPADPVAAQLILEGWLNARGTA